MHLRINFNNSISAGLLRAGAVFALVGSVALTSACSDDGDGNGGVDPTPQVSPDPTPNMTPDMTPDPTPNMTPDPTPNMTPDPTDDGHGSEDELIEEACEHMELGPFENVTANADAAMAPDATFEHTSVTITLADFEGQKGGYAKLVADEEADFFIFLSADIPLEITNAGGDVIAPEESETVDECGEVAIFHVFELPAGEVTLKFGPTDATEVAMVVEEGGGHGHGDGHGDGEEALIEEACEHMELGPFENVTANADATMAPDATFEHTSVTIALADFEGQKGGYAKLVADEEADFYIFLSADIPLEVTDAGGNVLAPEESEAVDACGDVAIFHVFEFPAGEVTLKFGPTDATEVAMVVEEGGGHGHGDGHGDGEEALIEEACEHGELGPFENVTANADATMAPDATFEHTSVTIALADFEGQKGGYVKLVADEEADFFVFLSAEVPVEFTDAGGNVLVPEETEMIDACDEIAVLHVVEFPAGDITLKFGPTDATEVAMVVEEGGAHGEGDGHDHDH